MSIWGSLIGGVVGFSFAGPIGALIGSMVGGRISSARSSGFHRSFVPPQQVFAIALIKVIEPDLKEFTNTELMCGNSKVKILKPEWI